MTKLKISATAMVLLAGTAASLIIQHRAQAELRVRDESLQRQTAVLTDLSDENRRLSQLAEKMKNPAPLPPQELRELLKLRSQVGQLRRLETQKPPLAEKNAALKNRLADSPKRIAEEQAAPNYWPKEQLGFAGYATPESAMQSILAAMKSGDPAAWQSCCTPAAWDKLLTEQKNHGKSDAEIATTLKAMNDAVLSANPGFRIVDQTLAAPDQADVNVSFVGEGPSPLLEWR